MKVLVTGGAGFIGSHTVVALRDAGHDVVVLDDLSAGRAERLPPEVPLIVGAIEDRRAVDEAVRGVDAVIHLAARVSVPGSWSDPVAWLHTNVSGAALVLQAATAAGATRAVLASSCAVYGSPAALPSDEADPLAPESPYAASKLADEALASAWSRTTALRCVSLRYFNVFGPGQDPLGPYGAVIPRFVSAALGGQALTIYGDGEQTRDFVPVQDVARANLLAAVTPDVPTAAVFNVGTGRATSVNALARAVREVVGRPLTLVYEPPRPGDVRHSRAAVGAIAAALGWRPARDFEAALRDTIRSFAEEGA